MRKTVISCIAAILAISIVPLLGAVERASAGPVTESEAVSVADQWLAMELNTYAKVSDAERAQRLDGLRNRKVQYLVSRDQVVEKPPKGAKVLAYVVKYDGGGYVVVSGDDRILPVIVFDLRSEFRWDLPEPNYMRYYLPRTMANRSKRVESLEAKGEVVPVHRNWSRLRAQKLVSGGLSSATFDATLGTTLLHWATASWSQGTFYNDVVIANNGGIAGIPTGCTATAMAIQLKFHAWPDVGTGEHEYDDTKGDVTGHHWINYGAQTFNWSAMPNSNLTGPNANVAVLMYVCGVAVDMNYEVGGSGAWPSESVMDGCFRYRGTEEADMDHDRVIQMSVLAGLPTIASTTTHTVVVAGYRDTTAPYYYINAGHDGYLDGWYNFDTLPASDPTIDRSYPFSAPDTYRYADAAWAGPENGALDYPYNTVGEAVSAVPSGGRLWFKAANYNGTGNVPATFNKPMAITSHQGIANVGGKIALRHKEGDGITYKDLPTIKISGSGMVKVY